MRTLVDGALVSALTLGCVFLAGSGAARASPGSRAPSVVLVENTDSTLCGMTTPRYGTIGVGSNVTLGRHSTPRFRPWLADPAPGGSRPGIPPPDVARQCAPRGRTEPSPDAPVPTPT